MQITTKPPEFEMLGKEIVNVGWMQCNEIYSFINSFTAARLFPLNRAVHAARYPELEKQDWSAEIVLPVIQSYQQLTMNIRARKSKNRAIAENRNIYGPEQ